MEVRFLLFFALFCYRVSYAQNNSTILVKAGSSIREAVPAADLYAYPQFVQGSVFFRDGSSSGAVLNYNRFLDEIQFISARGDTLAIANEKTIRYVSINTDTFFYDQGYVKLLNDNEVVKLAVKQTLKIVDKRKLSAYGTSSSTSAIGSYTSYTNGIRFYNLVVAEDFVLTRGSLYFLGNKYNHFLLANKRNVFELFPKQEGVIKNYLKENAVDFNNRADLERLVQFLAHL